jgi:hypothetical protein
LHLSATPTAPLHLHAAYRTRPSPRDRYFTSSPLHASFALWHSRDRRRHHRQRRRRQQLRRRPKDVVATVGLGPPVSPKKERHGRIYRPCRRGWRRLAAAIWIAS